MNCKSVQNRLSAYIDRELSGTEMLAVRAHLTCCEMCRIEEEGLRMLKRVLSETPVREPSADFADRLAASIRAERAPIPMAPVPLFRRPSLAFIGVALASMAVTFTIVNALQAPSTSSGMASRPPASSLALDVQRDQALMIGSDATSGAPLISASTYGAR
jgi:anti-sigma factor RsiW